MIPAVLYIVCQAKLDFAFCTQYYLELFGNDDTIDLSA
jgi:hypothetical protein